MRMATSDLKLTLCSWRRSWPSSREDIQEHWLHGAVERLVDSNRHDRHISKF
jgi:hypothetical protein